MFRNKEIQKIIFISAALVLAISLLCGWLNWIAGVACFWGMASLALGFFLYTRWRYQKINELALYLRNLSTGNYRMDIRDNREGELSILKNEIYKLVHILLEQSSLLEKEKRALSDTLLDISHQLKTPLTSIQMMTDLLENPALPHEKRQEFLFNIASESNRMEWLVLSMLKMAQLDTGVVAMKKEMSSGKIELVELLRQVVAEIASMPAAIKNDFEILGDEKPIYIIGDYKLLRRGFSNLLVNSVVHNPDGTKITVQIINDALPKIQISDNGSGMNEDDTKHLFDRYYRGTATDTPVGGTGLGMAIVKQIIEAHHGTIEVQSKLGEGTVFILQFHREQV